MKDNALVHWFTKEEIRSDQSLTKEEKTLQMLKLLPIKHIIHKEQERAQNLLISLSNYPTLAAFTSSFDHEHHASLMLYASFQLILSPKGQKSFSVLLFFFSFSVLNAGWKKKGRKGT